jgi:outer membrane protein assembly factor BamD (BamD/ComL family)
MLYIFILTFLLLGGPLSAAYTLKSGKLIHTEEAASLSVQEHYSLAVEAFQKEDWKELVRQANIVIVNFPETPFFQESLFYLGASYFHLEEYDLANKHLSRYLKKQAALQHFREAIELKFHIAEKYKDGAKKRIGGFETLPKWMPAEEEALKIYEEVISALPNDEFAARALFGKAAILFADEDYTAAIETYQTLIRRFPKNFLAPESYIQIGKVYLTQSQEKYPDADYLDLAEISLRKFKQSFPSDTRVAVVEKIFADMQEVYARSFYEIGQFFERTKKESAALLYYSKIVKTYPNTPSAELSKARLQALLPPQEPQEVPPAVSEQPLAPVPELLKGV